MGEGVDQWSNFLGQVIVNKQGDNLACMLLNMGYAEVYPQSAERSPFKGKLMAAEAVAKEAKKGRWENWSPEQDIAEETTEVVSEEQAKPVARDIKHPMQGKKTTGFITHIDSGAQFFVNLGGEENQDRMLQISQHMLSVNPATTDIPDGWTVEVEKRPVLAALFQGDGNYYRFRVMNVNKKKKEKEYRGLFIDFGNTEWVKESQLLPLKAEIAEIPPQALKCTLAGLKPPLAKSDYYASAGRALDALAYNRQLNLRFLKVLSEWRGKYEVYNRQSRITLFDVEVTYDDGDDVVSVNKKMTESGHTRLDKKKEEFYAEGAAKEYLDQMRKAEKTAQENNAGMYQYGVGFDSDEEDEGPRR